MSSNHKSQRTTIRPHTPVFSVAWGKANHPFFPPLASRPYPLLDFLLFLGPFFPHPPSLSPVPSFSFTLWATSPCPQHQQLCPCQWLPQLYPHPNLSLQTHDCPSGTPTGLSHRHLKLIMSQKDPVIYSPHIWYSSWAPGSVNHTTIWPDALVRNEAPSTSFFNFWKT